MILWKCSTFDVNVKLVRLIIDVVIPAYNEENAIAKVIAEIPRDKVRHIVVCNNGSTDNTKAVAKSAGAIVVNEPTPGYGRACLKGMAYLEALDTQPDILVYIDGDYSDYPEQLPLLTDPIEHHDADLVIGSRARGDRQRGSMTIPQILGNWIATNMIRWIYGLRFTDLGPFRAVRWTSLMAMQMQDKTYGWTCEMQVKAAKMRLSSVEIPVNYRQRIGVSKVSGTLKGATLAAYKIITTILIYTIKK